jgi:hypothetical protein
VGGVTSATFAALHHRQRHLVEQTAFLGAENERLQADLAKADESNRNLLDWQREAEQLRLQVEILPHAPTSGRR